MADYEDEEWDWDDEADGQQSFSSNRGSSVGGSQRLSRESGSPVEEQKSSGLEMV